MVVLSLVLPMEADDIDADTCTYFTEPGVRQILGVPLRDARNC